MTLKKNDPFRLDVSYLARQSPGTSRTFELDYAQLNFEPDFTLRDVQGQLTVSVTDDGVAAEGNLEAWTELGCSRCLERYEQHLDLIFTEVYSFHPAQDKNDKYREQLLPPDGVINLEPLLREYALLDIPIKHVCREDCKGLCPVCGVNLNEEDCGHRQEDIDPRMSKLKQLLDEDEVEEMEKE